MGVNLPVSSTAIARWASDERKAVLIDRLVARSLEAAAAAAWEAPAVVAQPLEVPQLEDRMQWAATIGTAGTARIMRSDVPSDVRLRACYWLGHLVAIHVLGLSA